MFPSGDSLDALPAIPGDGEGPVFSAPWEAHAFALAVTLVERGLFSQAEWAQALGAEIKAAQQAGDRDLGDTYYRHWLNALERLVSQKGAVRARELGERKEDWRRAYLGTPHGKAVALGAARRPGSG